MHPELAQLLQTGVRSHFNMAFITLLLFFLEAGLYSDMAALATIVYRVPQLKKTL